MRFHFPPQAAIVDLDGTMVDTLGDFHQALNATFAELALPAIGADAIEGMVGKGSEHLILSALRHVGAGEGRYEAAWQGYQRHYANVNGRHSKVYDGVVDGLGQLRARGLVLGCVTNKPTAFARVLLQDKGLAAWFQVVFGGDAFARKKPDPQPLLETCRALGTAPQRTLVIGDSSNDAAAARAAGCPVVLVTYGYNHGRPVQEVDADGFVDSLAQIARLLA
jgi:phosphoglycolate phosphatase